MSVVPANDGAATERLFVACEPADATRAQLASLVAAAADRLGALPVPMSNLHLTLVFLGATPAALIPPISNALASACGGLEPIHARLRNVSGIPGNCAARLVAAVFDDPDDVFGHAAATILQRLAPICHVPPVPMPFWPHVTLARLRRALPLAPISAQSEQMFAFDRITLYASRSAPSGPVQYAPLARIALTANDSPH